MIEVVTSFQANSVAVSIVTTANTVNTWVLGDDKEYAPSLSVNKFPNCGGDGDDDRDPTVLVRPAFETDGRGVSFLASWWILGGYYYPYQQFDTL